MLFLEGMYGVVFKRVYLSTFRFLAVKRKKILLFPSYNDRIIFFIIMNKNEHSFQESENKRFMENVLYLLKEISEFQARIIGWFHFQSPVFCPSL